MGSGKGTIDWIIKDNRRHSWYSSSTGTGPITRISSPLIGTVVLRSGYTERMFGVIDEVDPMR